MSTVNQQDDTSSEWHIVKETRKYKDIKGTYEATFIQRNNELIVERLGFDRPEEWTEDFVCRGNFGEFKFKANRWDIEKVAPIDTYTVFLYDFIKEPDLGLAKSHAKDIESALLNYPLHRIHNNKPAKKVIFHIGDARHPKAVTAEEISK